MAKNSRRVVAAFKSASADIKLLDLLPPLKSVALTMFFDSKGDITHITPRWDRPTDEQHLTASAEPSP